MIVNNSLRVLAVLVTVLMFSPWTEGGAAQDEDEVKIALNLAKLLQAARSVISSNQKLINDPNVGDKGLTGDKVLAAAMEIYKKTTNVDLNSIDPFSREGGILKAELASIKEAIDDNQHLINEKGIGFKGFIPAVFARLVTERM